MTVTTAGLPSGAFASGNEIVGNQGGATKRLTLSTAGLSDFEQPTLWTPTLYGATTAGITTYTQQNGTYTRIGSIVSLNFTLIWTNLTGTGPASIGGLPFNARNYSGVQRYALGTSYYHNLSLPSGKVLAGYLQDNTSFIRLANKNNATMGDATDLQTEMTTAGELYGSITYII